MPVYTILAHTAGYIVLSGFAALVALALFAGRKRGDA